MNLEQRLEAIEADIEAARSRWLDEIDQALRMAAQPGELECFERALARSCGQVVTDGDAAADDAAADSLMERIPRELLTRSWALWPTGGQDDSVTA